MGQVPRGAQKSRVEIGNSKLVERREAPREKREPAFRTPRMGVLLGD